MGTLFDGRLEPFDADALGLGVAIALALLLEGGDSVREQFVRAITSAEMDRTKRTAGRIEQWGAGDTMGS